MRILFNIIFGTILVLGLVGFWALFLLTGKGSIARATNSRQGHYGCSSSKEGTAASSVFLWRFAPNLINRPV